MRIEFYVKTGILVAMAGGKSIRLRATSGNGLCLNNPSIKCQKKSNTGPLPIGYYYIKPNELSNPGFLHDLGRNLVEGDWGDFRVRLHPSLGTKSYGRSNFFLHGGSISGSAGCIDVGGGLLGNERTDILIKMIKKQHSLISVVVKAW